MQRWRLEESLTNLFSAGSSVSEKGFNHLFAVRTSTKHTSKSLLERGNYWEGDLNKQNCAKSALTLLANVHYTYTSLNTQGWTFQLSSLSDHILEPKSGVSMPRTCVRGPRVQVRDGYVVKSSKNILWGQSDASSILLGTETPANWDISSILDSRLLWGTVPSLD